MTASSSQPRQNRFVRHRKKTVLAILVLFLLSLELGCWLVVLAKGHQEKTSGYRYNRILSGYTVYRNTPHFDIGSSTIKADPSDPDARLDRSGFLCDEPVNPEKPPGTVRIFIVGGSMAMGAGQNHRYHGVHRYPAGVYTYRLSIAGCLEQFLETEDPARDYQVITAAGFGRQFHQSLGLYLEQLSRFSPDYVVNIDGFNDIGSLVTGTPYADAEQMLPHYVDLYTRSKSWFHGTNTYYVFSRTWDKLMVGLPAPAPEFSGGAAVTRDEYRERRSIYVDNAERFLQIADHYFAALTADGVQGIFVLQPVLHREPNKDFSDIERNLAAVKPFAGDPHATDRTLILEYFFDDYLSEQLDRRVTAAGGEYLDMNRELRELSSSVEFYTDYCHLTPEGNRFVAEIVAESILRKQNQARPE